MRIVIIGHADFPEGRGPARYIHMMAKGMVAQGHHVSVVIPFAVRPGPTEQNLDGIDVSWCYVPRSARGSQERVGVKGHLLSRLRLVAKLLVMSLQRHYDWVLLYHLGIEGLLIAAIARITGHNVASQYVDIRWSRASPTLAQRMFDFTLSVADTCLPRLSSVIFVISTTLGKKLQRVAPGVMIVRIPPMIDVKLFAAGDGAGFRKRWGLSGYKLVVYAGSFWVGEGIAKLIEAMAVVVQEHGDAKLVIAGGAGASTDADDVEGLIDQHGLADRTVLLGQISLHEVIDLLAAADVLVVSKIDRMENRAAMPIKIAEYLAAGRPVVSSSIGDIPLYLHHRETALLCEPGNVSELAKSICALLSDKDLADKIANQGQKLANEVFDIVPNTARMLAAFEQAS